MGFFNFFYNLKFFLRRMPKKILVTIIIILILLLFSTKSHAFSETYQLNEPANDVVQTYKLQYDTYVYKFVRESITIAKNNNNVLPGQIRACFEQMARGGLVRSYYNFMDKDYISTYVLENGQTVNPNGYTIGIFITTSTPNGYDTYTVESAKTNSTVEYGQLSTSHYTSGRLCMLDMSNHTFTSTTTNNSAYLINAFEHYIPTDLYDIIYSLANQTFDFTTTDEILTSIDNHIENLETVAEDTNNFLQDDTIDNYTTNDLPSNSMNDITSSGFNSIFTKLYNNFTDTGYHEVIIPLQVGPYDRSFSLNSNSLNFVKASRQLISFIELCWNFAIYYYIYKDIYKLINDLSQGRLTAYVDNIKSELL